MGLLFGSRGRELQQTRTEGQVMAPLLERLAPLAPEGVGLLPQPPAPATAAAKDAGHQQAEGCAAAGLLALGLPQVGVKERDLVANPLQVPGHGKAHHTGSDHADRGGPAGGQGVQRIQICLRSD